MYLYLMEENGISRLLVHPPYLYHRAHWGPRGRSGRDLVQYQLRQGTKCPYQKQAAGVDKHLNAIIMMVVMVMVMVMVMVTTWR